MVKVAIKRAYLPAEKSDGKRILIDRLWPRGIKKEKAGIDFWLKDVAPSTELRKWFGHDPEKWNAFRKRYKAEIRKNPNSIESIRDVAKHGPVTLIYAARDEEHNDAVVLREYLETL